MSESDQERPEKNAPAESIKSGRVVKNYFLNSKNGKKIAPVTIKKGLIINLVAKLRLPDDKFSEK